MSNMPEVKEIREYKTEYLDAQLEAAFAAIDKLNANPNIATLEGRNHKMWQAYRNRLLRIADARDTSHYYRWFNENSLSAELD